MTDWLTIYQRSHFIFSFKMYLYRHFPWRYLIVVELVVLLILIFTIAISLPSFGPSTKANSVRLRQTPGVEDMAGELDYPLFNFNYLKIPTAATDSKVARDPCSEVPLANGGAKAKSVEGITVLVTGVAGFIGSNLVDRLLELGYKVRIFDNLYTGFIRNVPLHNQSVEFFFGDISSRDDLRKAVNGVDYVFHLAAMSKVLQVLPSLKSPEMARFCTESNALGSWNVLDAVRSTGNIKKVIYAASSTYYGNNPAPHREDMAPDFLTPYAASKYEGELQMQMFDRLFKYQQSQRDSLWFMDHVNQAQAHTPSSQVFLPSRPHRDKSSVLKGMAHTIVTLYMSTTL
jgi:UDP-glucose 4-epimerase